MAAKSGKMRELIAAVTDEMITAQPAPAADPSAPPEARVKEENTELIERNMPSHSESEAVTDRKIGSADTEAKEDRTTERDARINEAVPSGKSSARNDSTTMAKSVVAKAKSSLFLPESSSFIRFSMAAGETAE